MRVLSVKQPWAWGLVFGAKRLESRSWRTLYRGPLAIHASLSRSALGDDNGAFDLPDLIDFGSIIGIVDLVDCVPVAKVFGEPFAEGPWCWVTANPRPLASPFDCRGALGLWSPPRAFAEIHCVPALRG